MPILDLDKARTVMGIKRRALIHLRF